MGDNNGWTQLYHSAKNDSHEYIKSLEDMGINIHLKTNDGKNCLHIAAAYGHLNLCKTFIQKHKFHVYMIDNKGYTPLHCSAQNDVYEIVQFFTDIGTDILLKTKIGENCLHIAAAYGHLNLCQTLIDKHNFHVDTTDNEGFTTLHRSAQSGVYELVKFFADKGGDIHLKTKVGGDCLHIAAAYGHLSLCKTLIDKDNFDVDTADNQGFTALHRSAQSGSYEIVKLLTDRGADIYLKAKAEETCLHVAAAFGHLNLCETLINKHNFDVNMADNAGFTALHRSVQSGSYELVIFFANKGTDIHLKTEGGENCLHISATYGHLNLCKTLINKHNFNVDMANDGGQHFIFLREMVVLNWFNSSLIK